MNDLLDQMDEIAEHIKTKLDQGDQVSRMEAFHLIKGVENLRNEARSMIGLTLGDMIEGGKTRKECRANVAFQKSLETLRSC